MIGETSLDERIMNQLARTEKVRANLGQFFHGGLDHNEDLVRQLIFEAVWLATYEGLDFDTICQEVVVQTRMRFPDPC